MPLPARETGFVISDLHIFSCVSLYAKHLPMLEDAAGRHKVVVLNGDTFDFKRSRFSTNAETSQEAVRWLASLCLRHPATTFYFLIGNHDCNREFVEELRLLEKRCVNLHVADPVLQIGSCLFVHGDVCDLRAGETSLARLRERYSVQERSLGSIIFAQLVTHLRANIVEYVRHPRQALCQKIVSYLQATHPEKLASAERIYFGHTHVPFTDYAFAGLRFSNTGSAIRGLKMNALEFPLP